MLRPFVVGEMVRPPGQDLKAAAADAQRTTHAPYFAA
jgi:hypothetical protein